MNTENEFYRELITTLERKFDEIESKIDYLLRRVENGCYLCGNRNLTCKMTNCPYENQNSNLN